MDTAVLQLEHEGRISWLTLNRPEKRNAFSEELLTAFEAAIAELADRRETRVVVIRGAGGAFSAGADISPPATSPGGDEAAPRPPSDVLADQRRLERGVRRWFAVRDLPQPVIAAVEGHCFGIASQLCIMCDIVIAAEDANIGWPALPLGGGFISPMWTWLVGPGRAKYMSFRPGSTLTGKQAAEWGWATFAVPPTELESEVRRVAGEIARVPLEVLAVKKAAVNRQMDVMGFSTGVKMGVEYDALLHESDVVKAMRRLIREKGLRAAIDEFRSS